MSEQVVILGPKASGAARLPPPLPKPFSNILKPSNQSLPPAASTKPAQLIGSPANMSRRPPPISQTLNRATPIAPPQAATNPARVLPHPPAPGSVKPQAPVSAVDVARRFVPDAPPLPGFEPPKPLADRAKDFVSKIGSKVAAPVKAIGKALTPISAVTAPLDAYGIGREAFRQGVERGAHPIPKDDSVGRGNSIVGRAVQALDKGSKILPDSPEVQQRNAVVKASIQPATSPGMNADRIVQATQPELPIATKKVQLQAIPSPARTPTGDTMGLTPTPPRPAQDPSKENSEVPMRPKPPAPQQPTPAPPPPPPSTAISPQPPPASRNITAPTSPPATTPGPAATPATSPGDGAARTQARDAAAARTPMAPKQPASEKKSSGDKPIPGSDGGSFAGQPDWVKKAFSGGGNG